MEITVLVLADPGLPSVLMAGDPGPNEVSVAVNHDLRPTKIAARSRPASHARQARLINPSAFSLHRA